jgi:hypothetical protein
MSFLVNDPARPCILSKDRGGPAVVFVDATTWRLRSTTEPEVVGAMTTIAGGEPIDDARAGR